MPLRWRGERRLAVLRSAFDRLFDGELRIVLQPVAGDAGQHRTRTLHDVVVNRMHGGVVADDLAQRRDCGLHLVPALRAYAVQRVILFLLGKVGFSKLARSEERRVGNERVSTWRLRRTTENEKKKT